KVGQIEVQSKGEVQSLAATSGRTFDSTSGSLELKPAVKIAASIAPSALVFKSLGGSVSFDGDASILHEASTTRKGGVWHGNGDVFLRSGSMSDSAVHVEGTKINAPRVFVATPNGGSLVESAQSEAHTKSWKLNPGGGIEVDLNLLTAFLNQKIQQAKAQGADKKAEVQGAAKKAEVPVNQGQTPPPVDDQGKDANKDAEKDKDANKGTDKDANKGADPGKPAGKDPGKGQV
ncbi:hypothetical protein ACQV9O_26945, partial [Ralstonia pseudosolanacearum]